MGQWLQGGHGGQGWNTETKDLNYKASGTKQRFTGAETESTSEEKPAKASKLCTGEGQSKSNL